MKTINKPFIKSVYKFVFLTPFFLILSCYPDYTGDPGENDSVLTKLTKGAILKGANGIDIGPYGNLYIASVQSQKIVVMNKKTGKIIHQIGQEMGVKSPDDLVFGPDGSLYWTDILVGEVGRLTPEGVLTKQFVAPGVNPITFSPDGRLFVALDFLGDGFYELDPNLIEPPRPIIISTETIPFPLGFFNAFDFGVDGRLYGPLFAAGLVISVDVDPSGDLPSSDPFGSGIAQVVATGFKNPSAAKFGPEGILYVLDQTGEVFKVNIETGDKTLFTTLEPGIDNLVFDVDNRMYVTNNDQGWVAEILPSGEAHIISRGGLIAPQGLTVLAGPNNQDNVFVADLYNLRQLNGRNGEQENIYKGFLVPESSQSLILPMNLSSDGNNIVVSSWFSRAVQVWDSQTNQVLENYVMGAPIDALRFNDDIVVSDLGLGGLFWASDNSMILPIEENATIIVPSGLATDGETVWVGDWATGNILEISFEGNTPNTPVVVASGLENPEGLAFEEDGSLVVVETGASRLSRIDLSTGEVTKIVDGLELSGPGLEGSPPTWLFDGVAIGESGDIYVSGGGTNVIYRIK